ncbi:hypothetical protein [Azospirillum sp.]|uniref:hypothetical protein n=1 Tax=Azospirillum sp. TaxID=34012 RepID=UPI003D751EEA
MESHDSTDGDGPADGADPWVVFAIVDPSDHRVFYVGTLHGARAYRMGEHPRVDERLRALRQAGTAPVFVVLEETRGGAAAERAQVFWVEVLLMRGNRLLNEGGYRPPARTAKPKLTPEQREHALRQRALERGLPENTGQPWTAEQDADLARLYRDEVIAHGGGGR